MQIGPVLPLQLMEFPISNQKEEFRTKAQQKAVKVSANPASVFSHRFIQISHRSIEISLYNEAF